MPALAAGARVARAVEALEHGWKILLDITERKEFLIQFMVAFFAEPQQPVLFMRQSFAFNHQADGCGHALR